MFWFQAITYIRTSFNSQQAKTFDANDPHRMINLVMALHHGMFMEVPLYMSSSNESCYQSSKLPWQTLMYCTQHMINGLINEEFECNNLKPHEGPYSSLK